ncbi:MAG: N,N-dimethylformamidase beta subunit family domain-containing protein [Acidimicrobiales bacterium]
MTTEPGPAVEGYPEHLSYEPGDEVRLHFGATVARLSGRVRAADGPLPCRIEVARAQGGPVLARTELEVAPGAVPADAAARSAGWSPTWSVRVGAQWAPGWYEVRIRTSGPTGETLRHAGFCVRAPARRPTSSILLVLSTSTWNAYNDWGGPNLYTGGVRVSFRRPFARGLLDRPEPARHRNAAEVPDVEGALWAAHFRSEGICSWSACAGWPTWEAPFVDWAERAGYRFDYAVSTDLEERPEVLDGHRLYLSVGHDEYWSGPMRDTVERFVHGGGNAVFCSGNTSFWQVRFESADSGVDPSDRHVMVGYKGTARRDDPLARTEPARMTGMWSDPRIGRSEHSLTGVSFTRGGYARIAGATPAGQRGYTVWQPRHWVFEGTDLRYGDLLGGIHGVVGYECDGCELTLRDGLPVPTHADGCPEGFEVLASAPARLWSVDPSTGENDYPTGLRAMRPRGELQDVAKVLFGDDSARSVARIAHGSAVLGTFTAPGRGTVVTTGCTDWAYGLEGEDPTVEQVTRNLLDRLSV